MYEEFGISKELIEVSKEQDMVIMMVEEKN